MNYYFQTKYKKDKELRLEYELAVRTHPELKTELGLVCLINHEIRMMQLELRQKTSSAAIKLRVREIEKNIRTLQLKHRELLLQNDVDGASALAPMLEKLQIELSNLQSTTQNEQLRIRLSNANAALLQATEALPTHVDLTYFFLQHPARI